MDLPASANPSKPIGRFLEKEEAQAYANDGWGIIEDGGRGWHKL